MVLTDAGRVLAEHADRLLAAEEEARRAVDPLADDVAGRVCIGVWGSSAAALLAPLWHLVVQTHPSLRLTSREVSVDTVAAAVRAHDVDLAFGLDYPDAPMPRDPGTLVTPLLRETFWVASPPRWRQCPDTGTDLTDWAEQSWILPVEGTVMGRAVYAAFRPVGVEPRVVHEVTDSTVSLQLVSQGSVSRWRPTSRAGSPTTRHCVC